MAEAEARRHSPAWADTLLGLGVTAFAGVLAWQASEIPVSPLYARVGPAVLPWIVVAMLGALGLALLVTGLRGGWDHEDDSVGAFDGRGAFWLGLGLLLNLVLIDGIDFARFGLSGSVPGVGFILASTAMFICVARAFGSPRPLRDAAIGFLIALSAYVGFDQLLGYRIGDGLIENRIQALVASMGRTP